MVISLSSPMLFNVASPVITQENHKLELKGQATDKELRDTTAQLQEAKKDIGEMRKDAEDRIKILDSKQDEINNLKGKIEEGKLQVWAPLLYIFLFNFFFPFLLSRNTILY